MTRLLTVLLFGLVLEAVGVVLLSQGFKELGNSPRLDVAGILQWVQQAATNRHLILGIALEAAFFGCLLFLMSHGDVSFVWPLTSLGFVLTTLAARFILHEQVTWLRWMGVSLIVLGAGIITYTEKQKEKAAAAPSETASVPGKN